MGTSDSSATIGFAYDYDYDYSHYYSNDSEPHQNSGPCDKAHVKASAKILLPVLYTFVCALGIVGNTFLVFVLIKCIKLRSAMSMYLLNMAVSDILFAVTLPFWAVYAHSEWIFGDVGCKVITVIYTVNLYSSIFFITCISLDRYLSIVWASPTKSFGSVPKGGTVCAVVWAIAFLAAAPDLSFVKMQELDGKKTCVHDFGEEHTSLWRVFTRFELNILGFLMPFLAMLFFYLRIYCVAFRSKMGKKCRALRLAVALVVVFFVLWFPYNLVVLLHSLQDLHVMISDCAASRRLDLALQVTESLAFTHACLNPICTRL
ncbi:hypothetical protein AAFF_G00264300 [Aldrovandia affinis]|uniref:G-protein coupled receptors family 1 profile domain-containing protein n=1 Tax=Aldrovandia affinis TaxID=143900 RepID=A0AAD7SU37_9TELE|nr:hypothetical protein AAFF_G00264300 [Aldrovandia affinis]